MNTTSFSVFNASAGSGKTHTLVKEVLKILLQTPNAKNYQHLLAITFTNKAVAEMKDRVLNNLHFFSQPRSCKEPTEMMSALSEESKLSLNELHLRSRRVLKAILHNFSALEISTIDGFTHRVIRTFARDLGLSSSFEIVLDAEELLSEAVDALISSIEDDPELMKMLQTFALEKIAGDRSWDISFDLFETAKLMLDENHYQQLLTLQSKSRSDFSKLQKSVNQFYNDQIKNIRFEVEKVSRKMEELGLQESSFAYKDFPKFLKKCNEKKWNALKTQRLSQQMDEGVLYPKKLENEQKTILKNHFVFFSDSYNQLLKMCSQAFLFETIKVNLPTFSLINAIRLKLQDLQRDQNNMLISAFNKLISETINQQPAPFIYERLGVKFRHYFIDEFQDTSQLQWQNLIPLIAHSLEGSNGANVGSLLLVGDAKQSIYRWRGGRAEQFMALSQKQSPFSTDIETFDLTTNYRSFSQIVEFNNSFFQFVSELFQDTNHQQLYASGSRQSINAKKGGYVSLDFIDAKNAEEENLYYSKKVLETIQFCHKEGFSFADQCVLTRTKKQGALVSEFLIANGIPVISSETLLLQNSHEVQLLIALLSLQVDSNNLESRNLILNYIWNSQTISEEYYLWFQNRIRLPVEQFFTHLTAINFRFEKFMSASLYESMEIAIRDFKLSATPSAHIFYFMDAVFEFTQKHSTSTSSFLAHWEKQKEKLTITSGDEHQDAVRIMTIHKSKGLEFDVVIFPFAKTKINDFRNEKGWLRLDPKQYNGFSNVLIPLGKNTEQLGTQGELMFSNHLRQQELDTYNLLYVTLTRAKEQLYVISQKKSSEKESGSLTFAKVLQMYLQRQGLWDEDQSHYSWGQPTRSSEKTPFPAPPERLQWTGKSMTVNDVLVKRTHYWDDDLTAAVDFGLLFHEIIAKIRYSQEAPQVLESYRVQGIQTEQDLNRIEKAVYSLINHSELSIFYSEEMDLMIERSIVTKNGEWLIPDRIITDPQGQTTILDYKTGTPKPQYTKQINAYANALEDMGMSVKNRWIVYVNDSIEIVKQGC